MDTTSPESLRRALKKFRHKERAPILPLPSEVLASIFSLLSVFSWDKGQGPFGFWAWIYVSHVCRRWHETALNYLRFWSHVNFTKLTPAGLAEILSRAKTAPLHLEAFSKRKSTERFEALRKQLEAHISHTRHLKLSGWHLSMVIEQLMSPAPALASLALSHTVPEYTTIPDNLFDSTVPSLTTLMLQSCTISWKSPLFKGLRTLKIHFLPEEARPELDYWLDALDEIPQLKELSLRYATPVAVVADPPKSRTVTLPFLTHFFINASPKDCALALAHLVFPTLTWLHIHVYSEDKQGEDVLQMIPSVVQNASVLHGIKPIRGILIGDEPDRHGTEILTWTTPGGDVNICGPAIVNDMSRSACFMFHAQGYDKQNRGVPTAIFDAFLTLLPLDSVSTFTAQNHTQLSKEFWLRHAPKLPLLEQARLGPKAAKEFWEMLTEDIPLDSDRPQLPMLTKLILHRVPLSGKTWGHLRDTLIERVEQGVPLKCLDLSAGYSSKLANKLFSEIVVDLRKPSWDSSSGQSMFKGAGNAANADEFNDGRDVWYSDPDTEEEDDYDDRYDDQYDENWDDDEDYDDRFYVNRPFGRGIVMRL